MFIHTIDKLQKITSLIIPVFLELKSKPMKKLNTKYADLMRQAQKASGIKKQ